MDPTTNLGANIQKTHHGTLVKRREGGDLVSNRSNDHVHLRFFEPSCNAILAFPPLSRVRSTSLPEKRRLDPWAATMSVTSSKKINLCVLGCHKSDFRAKKQHDKAVCNTEKKIRLKRW